MHVCILYVMRVLSVCMWYACVVCEVSVVCVFHGGVCVVQCVCGEQCVHGLCVV